MTLNREYRLYITTVIGGHQNEEGPYRFSTAGMAFEWMKLQTHVEILRAELWHLDEVIARADAGTLEMIEGDK